MRREVVGDGSIRGDRGNGVLEDQLIRLVGFDDDGEAIEVLDSPLKLAAVEQRDRYREPVAPCVVEENVLDIGL